MLKKFHFDWKLCIMSKSFDRKLFIITVILILLNIIMISLVTQQQTLVIIIFSQLTMGWIVH